MIIRGFTTEGTAEKLTPFPSCGGGSGTDTDDQQAQEVPYDNSGSGLGANDVQEAIDELAAQVAACCDSMAGGAFSSGDLLSTGELGGSSDRQDQIYPDFVTPIDGDFAWINQGGASITVNGNGGLYLLAPAVGSENLRVRKKAAPSTPYTITIAVIPNIVNANFGRCGLVFRQSSDGKLITFGVSFSTGGPFLECLDFTSPTLFSGGINASATFISGTGVTYLRMTDSGTNRIFSFSEDGENFTQFFSEGRTAFLTADEVGFFTETTTASWDAGCTFLSWEES